MKNRLRTAQVGHDLLKRKSDALVVRFRNILSRIVDTKTLMGEVIKEASWSLAEAKYTMGDFGEQIIQDVDKASVKVKTKLENVVGKVGPLIFFRVSFNNKIMVKESNCARLCESKTKCT